MAVGTPLFAGGGRLGGSGGGDAHAGIVLGGIAVGAELDDVALGLDALIGEVALGGSANVGDVALRFGAHVGAFLLAFAADGGDVFLSGAAIGGDFLFGCFALGGDVLVAQSQIEARILRKFLGATFVFGVEHGFDALGAGNALHDFGDFVGVRCDQF